MEQGLQVVGVSKQFASGSGTPVLQDISLAISPGRVVGLMGESGSGKTTLARIIIGLLAPSTGAVRLQGDALPVVSKRSFAQAAAIQHIFQDPYAALEPYRLVRDILQEPVRLCRRYRHHVTSPEEAVRLAGLGDYAEWAERPASMLSGGQRQRLAIARALIPNPRFLIADESTSMLDEDTARGVLRLLRRLCVSRGMGILLISHQAHVVTAISDTMHIMYRGQLVEEGSPQRVLESPVSDYGKAVVSSIRYLQGGLRFDKDTDSQH